MQKFKRFEGKTAREEIEDTSSMTRQARRNLYQKRWRDKKKRMGLVYTIRIEPAKNTCLECGKEFAGRKGRMFCSPKCGNRNWIKRKKGI